MPEVTWKQRDHLFFSFGLRLRRESALSLIERQQKLQQNKTKNPALPDSAQSFKRPRVPSTLRVKAPRYQGPILGRWGGGNNTSVLRFIYSLIAVGLRGGPQNLAHLEGAGRPHPEGAAT